MRARRWLLVIFGLVAFPLAAQQPGAAPPPQNSGNTSQSLELPPAIPASQAELQSTPQDTLEKKQSAAASEESHSKEAVGEEDLAKILFERRTKTPDNPEPKAGATENQLLPWWRGESLRPARWMGLLSGSTSLDLPRTHLVGCDENTRHARAFRAFGRLYGFRRKRLASLHR
jgi:hypothetical protein